MINITIDVKDNTFNELEALGERLADRKGLHEVLGRSVEGSLRDHFADRQNEPNKRGWPKQQFWDRIRNRTAFSGATESEASVVIADRAMAAKVYGARIVPKEKKMLAIPLRAEVYGVMPRAKTIPGLFLWKSPRGNLFLAAKEQGGKALRIFWLLVSRANVPADPKALPSEAVVGAGMVEAAGDFLAI